MPAWLIALLPILAQQLLPIVIAGVGAGAGFLVHKYVKNQKLVDAFDWLRAHVGPVVAAVEQTYVDAITKNGTLELSPAQKASALAAAVASVLEQIPADYLAALREAYPGPGQLERVITTLIEGAVKTLELQRKAGSIKLTALALPAGKAGPTPIIPPPPSEFVDVPGLTNEKASGR